ncbi:MAG: T9SS type A sorting domain-containing protein [Flavobacteriales bacterium]|nr:T9SS type A sorting domain-containing protein [Flavobacteriales bacterium]
MRQLIILLLVAPLLVYGQQGPYAPAAGQTGSTAIGYGSSRIIDWAGLCTIERGYQNVSDTSLGLAFVGNESAGENESDGSVVSIGDGGIALLTFNQPISNTIGADIAVFENSFSDYFLELAYVEISSDGINFFRFPSVSLTNSSVQVNGFGVLDPTNIYNLAGKYRGGYGTPFDFEELDSIMGLNIDSISYVRIIDVVGSVDSGYASYDSQGNVINDPWPTAFASSGFDLDAVAAIGEVTGIEENEVAGILIYPNPVINELFISGIFSFANIYDVSGDLVKSEYLLNQSIRVAALSQGIYFIELIGDNQRITQRFVKL